MVKKNKYTHSEIDSHYSPRAVSSTKSHKEQIPLHIRIKCRLVYKLKSFLYSIGISKHRHYI